MEGKMEGEYLMGTGFPLGRIKIFWGPMVVTVAQ